MSARLLKSFFPFYRQDILKKDRKADHHGFLRLINNRFLDSAMPLDPSLKQLQIKVPGLQQTHQRYSNIANGSG